MLLRVVGVVLVCRESDGGNGRGTTGWYAVRVPVTRRGRAVGVCRLGTGSTCPGTVSPVAGGSAGRTGIVVCALRVVARAVLEWRAVRARCNAVIRKPYDGMPVRAGVVERQEMKTRVSGYVIVLVLCMTGVTGGAAWPRSVGGHVPAGTTISGVPYVWQELNGFCTWAALTTAFRCAGADIDMYDMFALTGVGFSFAYLRYNDTMIMYPGVMYMQAEPADFAADLLGLNLTIYMDADMPGADQYKQIWEGRGVRVGLLDGYSDAFELMRSSIDSGCPLVVSVDPSWLPAPDYDYLRERGLSGGGHAVVLVGYDDHNGSVTFMDPGVGSFGDMYGYPDDGRGNYSVMTYTTLRSAWQERYFISMLVRPMGTPTVTPGDTAFSDTLGPAVRDRLLGAPAAYFADATTSLIWHFGETGFRELSKAVTADGLTEYLSVFGDQPSAFRASLVLFIGLAVESQVTLQYLSFRKAATSLARFMPDVDLSDFEESAAAALPHMAALSDNGTLLHPGNLSQCTGPVASLFRAIADELNATDDYEGTLRAHSAELAQVSTHLLGIADAWKSAGEALADIWPNNPLVVYAPLIAVGSFAVGALVVVVVLWARRRPSQ